MSRSTTNSDGFGIGWYGGRERPGLFCDILPPWNDDNLLSVPEQIRSGLFFSHVRASTGTQTSHANYHPFRYGRWLFMHNDPTGGYGQVRHRLDLLIDPALYPGRAGTTDSETFSYLLLRNGLEGDVEGAFARTLAVVVAVMDEAEISAPFHKTAVLSDGARVGVRGHSDPLGAARFEPRELDGGARIPPPRGRGQRRRR
jgi:glutamine amidotransferase